MFISHLFQALSGFPDSSVGKEPTCNAGDPGSIPGSGIFAGEGIGYPLQYSCLGHPRDRGAWRCVEEGLLSSFYGGGSKPWVHSNCAGDLRDVVFPGGMYGCESWTVKKAE